MADRGQSEVVGFVLVFGIIVLAVGVVAATGFGGLQNVREHERVNNAELAFVVLADNVDDVTSDGAPSRATEVDLGEATLAQNRTITVTVEGTSVSNPAENFSYSYEIHPIVYDAGTGEKIVYSGGAIVRESNGGAVMVRDPDFLLTNERVVVPIVRTYPQGPRSVGGSSTVLVRTEGTGSELLEATSGEYDVTLTVTSPRAAAWERHLDAKPATDCNRSGDTVTCSVRTERVSLTVDHVAVMFA